MQTLTLLTLCFGLSFTSWAKADRRANPAESKVGKTLPAFKIRISLDNDLTKADAELVESVKAFVESYLRYWPWIQRARRKPFDVLVSASYSPALKAYFEGDRPDLYFNALHPVTGKPLYVVTWDLLRKHEPDFELQTQHVLVRIAGHLYAQNVLSEEEQKNALLFEATEAQGIVTFVREVQSTAAFATSTQNMKIALLEELEHQLNRYRELRARAELHDCAHLLRNIGD